MKILIFFLFLFANFTLLKAESYYIEAGKHFGIDPQILWAIAYKESRFNPNAISKANKNGSYDIGIMQINSTHLPRLKERYNISQKDLLHPKINIFIGAEILKMCFDKHGITQNGITCYNGRIKNNPYGQEVLKILADAKKKYAKEVK